MTLGRVTPHSIRIVAWLYSCPWLDGQKMLLSASEDENDKGRSEDEMLVDEGIAGVDHEQMFQASLKPSR